ncbi:MAG: alpha/beta hydrolase [Myxococcota bacterium]
MAIEVGVRLRVIAFGLLVQVGACGLWYPPIDDHLRAAAFLLRFEGSEDVEGLAGYGLHDIDEREAGWERGRARYYEPMRDDAPALLLVHGIHPQGIDEPRFVQFARSLASSGIRVMTPELPTLTEFRVSDEAVPIIAAAATAFAAEAHRETVGVVGISFGGGLSLLAAASPDGSNIGFVLSIGGHHDLRRVSRFFAGESVTDPDGHGPTVEPHVYGQGVLIYAHAERLFPEADLAEVRTVLSLMLHERFDAATQRLAASQLSSTGRTRLQAVVARRSTPGLRAEVLEALEDAEDELLRASPAEKVAGLRIPVFLVHGADDPIVPAIETRWLASELPEQALEEVLVTGVLSHAQYDRPPSLEERWAMVHFMARVLATVEAQPAL